MSRDLAYESLERALALCDLGRLADAEDALRQALRENPYDPIAHGILARVLLDLDRPEEALESASSSIALAPELSLGHVARAQALLALGRFSDAEAAANEAIQLDPEDSDPWVLLAAAFLGRNRYADAVSAADRALSLDPASEGAAGLRAVALAMTPGGADWREAAGDTLALGPDSATAQAYSGLAHLLSGGEREAADRFREALRLDPESEFAQVGLADSMKASHPLFKPFFRFFVWQSRLSRGARIALIVGPIVAMRALRPVAERYPVIWGLIGLWILFVVLTWLAVPIANVALRFSTVGRAVLPAEQKRSSTVFLAFVGAALMAIVLGVAVQWGLALAAFPLMLLASCVGSAHDLDGMRRRIVYAAATAAGLVAFTGGALIPVRVGSASLGAVLIVAALLSALVLHWTVRLG